MQDIYDCTVQYIIENQNKFYRLAYSYVKEEQAALDVIQNAICRALEGCFGLKTFVVEVLNGQVNYDN